MRTLSRSLVVAVLLAAAPSLLGACGGSQSTTKTAAIVPGSLPAGVTFQGVWYNPVWGELHMVQEGSTIIAKYKSQQSGVWGKINGKVDGDVIRFEWEEHKTGAIGPGSSRKGKGYWRFTPQEAPAEPHLKGEWGFGENEIGGGEWDAIRQKDVKPKLESIGGEADPSVDTGWDATPAEKKK